MKRAARDDLDLYCCRPGCAQTVTLRPKGRVQRFCSDPCRTNFSKTRQRLLANIGSLEKLLHEAPSTWTERVEVEGTLSLLRGVLARYRPFEP